MGRGLSELQKRIVVVMWNKRCEFHWQPNYRQWIGPGSEDDHLDDDAMWEDERNWTGELDQNARQDICFEFIKVADEERKKSQTSVNRAIDRLVERGLVSLSCRNRKYAKWTLTPWGSLIGWMLSEGRPLKRLASRRFPVHTDADGPTSAQSEAELDRIIHPEKYIHERIIAMVAKLEPWQQKIVCEQVGLMVETSTAVEKSTES